MVNGIQAASGANRMAQALQTGAAAVATVAMTPALPFAGAAFNPLLMGTTTQSVQSGAGLFGDLFSGRAEGGSSETSDNTPAGGAIASEEAWGNQKNCSGCGCGCQSNPEAEDAQTKEGSSSGEPSIDEPAE